jgi:hypothetical protein
MRQAFNLLGQAVGSEVFESLQDARMQPPSPLLEEAAIRHLMGQGVLEGILALWVEARLVQELRRLQLRQAVIQGFFGRVGDGLQQGPGHPGADDRRRLQHALLLGGQAVDAGRQHRLHRGGHLQAVERLGQARGAALARQNRGLYEGADALF